MIGEAELRLLWTLSLNAALLAGAWRFVRTREGDPLQRGADSILLWLASVYAIVGLLGAVGWLTPLAMSAGGLAVAAGLWLAARGRSAAQATTPLTKTDRISVIATLSFVGGCIAAMAYDIRFAPVLATDGLTYHFPAAAGWLQAGRITLHQTWFFNPANTYSPLGGSIFIAWMMAPMGSDILARFVQVPAAALLVLATLQLLRTLGMRPAAAAVLALAAMLSRPVFQQMLLGKDDLFVAAFFVSAAVALDERRLNGPFGLLRLGIAVGLMLAMKYTALMLLPVLLIGADALIRHGPPWRGVGTVGAIVAAVAGPWFLRNAIVTGNPLYPIDLTIAGASLFTGLFTAARSEQLASLSGLWHVLTGTLMSVRPALFLVLIVGWLMAAIRWHRAASHPIRRICLIGPALGILLFAIASPYAEVRFLLPVFLLLFACVGLAIEALPGGWGRAAALAGLLVLSAATATEPANLPILATYLGAGAAAGLLSVPASSGDGRLSRSSRSKQILLAVVLGVAAAATLAFWPTYAEDYRELRTAVWQFSYGQQAEAWQYIDDQLPPDSTIAYSQTSLIYPLYGFDLQRTLTYVPLQSGVKRIEDLGRIGQRLSGEQIEPAMWRAMQTEPDVSVWLENLRARRVDYLLLMSEPEHANAHESQFVGSRPGAFQLVFSNESARLYRVLPP